MGIVRRSLKKLVKGAFTWLVPKMRLVAHMVILGLIVSLAAAFSHPPAILNILLRVMLSCLCLGIASVILLRWINPPTSAFMIRSRSALRKAGKDDTIITQWVNYENCPMHLALAVIAAEDWNFYDHAGFDPESILNNWRNNRTGREIRGASTISQQLSKNLFLWPARSYFRKFIEAVITVFIEAALSKKRILEIYLNIIQFDAHLFGVGAAARYFFHKEVAELDEEEAALMAAVLINPIKYRVDAPSPLVRRRQAEILQTMNDRPLGAGVGTVA